jgi:hypothetical protein
MPTEGTAVGKRLAIGVLFALLGYVLGAAGGGVLISLFSANTHDKSVEAAMTGAFVVGPLMAAVGFLAGFLGTKGKRSGDIT